MPLDPLVKAFLDKAAAIPRPKAWDVPPAITRQSFAGMMQITGPKDVPVGKIENLVIPGPGGDIRARAYAPVAASASEVPAAADRVRVGAVLEHVVGFIDFLELMLAVVVARIAVRMMLHGQLAVGRFDLGIGRVAGDAEHFVVIAFNVRSRCSKGRRGCRPQ